MLNILQLHMETLGRPMSALMLLPTFSASIRAGSISTSECHGLSLGPILRTFRIKRSTLPDGTKEYRISANECSETTTKWDGGRAQGSVALGLQGLGTHLGRELVRVTTWRGRKRITLGGALTLTC